jgi:dihydrolipoamide dehydrogenase
LEKKFKKEKLSVVYGSDWKLEGNLLTDGEKSYEVDAIINASLRKAIIPDCQPGLELESGFIRVNEHLQTSVTGIYAVGDVNGKSYLAHVASAQGLQAVNHILGIETAVEASSYPLNIYSEPEIAQVGQTEQQIKAQGIDYKVSEFSLAANGKAMTEGNSEGSIRIISETKYGQVLGVQIIAANATDMIAEAGVLLELEGTIYDVARTVHAHPTVSEVFMEAGLVAIDQPVHK